MGQVRTATLCRTAVGLVVASLYVSVASASVTPIRGVLTARDVPAGVKLIADQNSGLKATAAGLRVPETRLRAMGYEADYSVQFLGLIHGSIVGIVSSVVAFRTSSGARDSVVSTRSGCPSSAADAYVCITKLRAGGVTLVAYRCVWSHGRFREAVSVNVAGHPIRPPGVGKAEGKAMAIQLAKIQALRS
jgi:hypothetical protein